MRLIQHAKEYYAKVMEIPDSSKKIAQGVALGTALDFLPIPFISIFVAYVLARLVGFNSGAAVLAAIFFKWAVPFFFALNYMVGSFITGVLLGGAVDNAALPAYSVTPDIDLNFWSKLKQIGYPFLIGSAINSLLAGTLIYTLFSRVLERHRERRKREKEIR
ncbi:DUF2062 domain-containing protein [Desulfolucanica intricata]|uniref:DUF2062 domain-containing protein n=1 Tax=Desulfolucanica intricata TaxID=1285191 RepID=UPI000A8B2A8E|nr:DUF2062 domain-containing protein [Desulfolucanica intricata]